MGCNCRGWPDEDVAESEIVMVEVPDGVTMGGGGGVTAALPPPHPEKLSVTQKIATERAPQSAKRFLDAAHSNEQ
jgi:hypothetical protein